MSEPLSILLIEDDEDDLVLARELLADAFPGRCELDWIDDWEAGLEAIGQNEHQICLVDYRLGERDVLELARLAADRGCKAPIILLTGMNDREIDVQAMEAGVADYLVKGEITPALLERSIRYALARQRFQKAEIETKELLKRSNQKLAELYKTAHQFVDNLSHEFRTPLTVIKEFASILADGLAGEVNEEQREYLGIITNRVDDLSLMVNDMLDISKLEADLLGVLRRECRVEEIVGRLGPILERKAAANGAELRVTINDSLPNVYCDPEKVGRVIVNLAVNAFKFSGEGGEVSLWARPDAARSQVVVGVTDNGPGIAPEDLQAIFERFKQVGGDVRASTKGFGLGLNIVKELVQLNFGDIEVESELGGGSTFTFTIPLFDPPRILERFMTRIEHFRNGSSYVSLIAARPEAGADPELSDDAEQFLHRQLRRGDLLFRTHPDGWLLCAATNQGGLDPMIARIGEARREANRNRVDGALPEIGFEIKGTWRVRDQGTEFINRFRAESMDREVCHA